MNLRTQGDANRMRRTRRLLGGILLLAGLMLTSGIAQAQQPVGHLQGRVFDESGGLLPGVTVVVTNTGTGAGRTVITNAQGFWSARALNPGDYVLSNRHRDLREWSLGW